MLPRKATHKLLPHLAFLSALVLPLSACSNPVESGLGSDDFEAAWSQIGTSYVHFELKGIDWDAVGDTYRPLIESARGESETDDLFVRFLAELKDPHVRFRGRGDRVTPYTALRTIADEGAFDPAIAQSRLSGEGSVGHVGWGTIEPGIGYVRIRSFIDGQVVEGVRRALNDLRDARGLVIDVRGNQGGSLAEITATIGRFTTESFQTVPVFFGGQRVAVPDVVPTGAFQYVNPVVVITDGVCVSACETFSEMMRSIATVTSLGGTTAGGGGSFSPELPGVIRLPSGREATVPTGTLLRYDGEHMEWNGVVPDIEVSQSRADAAAGRDPQLDAALQLLPAS